LIPIRLSHCCTNWISVCLSAWPIRCPHRISISIRLIRLGRTTNIQWPVSLIHSYVEWIFDSHLPKPLLQQLNICSYVRLTHSLPPSNIHWVSTSTDCVTQPIFDGLSGWSIHTLNWIFIKYPPDHCYLLASINNWLSQISA
jgi:hypothetical protein